MLGGSGKLMRKRMIGLVLCGALATQAVSSGTAAVDDLAAKASASPYVSAGELLRLFGGRTWVWAGSGGGFYANKKREYKAYAGKNQERSYADGTWFITDRGRVCVRAVWHSLKWKGKVLECLEHRSDGKQVFQRKLPKGDWYVFQNIPLRSGDPATQLVPGDRTEAGYERNKRFVTGS